MMEIFKRKKAVESEADLAVSERIPEQAPVAAPEVTPEAAASPAQSAQPEQSAYQPWSPEGTPPSLVMEVPKADAEELKAISDAGTLEEKIVLALKKVYDPEIPVNIYEMGLVYDIGVSPEKDVFVQMTLTSPGCPVAEQMPGMVEHAVHHFVEGVRNVEVEIVWDPTWTPDLMSEAAQLELGFI
jgi:FeS assembly SUF system protein